MNKEEKKEIEKDISKYRSLDTLSESNGGKILVKGLKEDIVSIIERLSNYKELSHIDFIVLASELKAKLTMMQILKNAKDKKAMVIECLEE